ncbi:MAG: ankyrin repeat domain-containing protein [Acidobacteria bacterium]|nr:ankyrin repeat domain-containing protein [Acidobacteriota bacterium]
MILLMIWLSFSDLSLLRAVQKGDLVVLEQATQDQLEDRVEGANLLEHAVLWDQPQVIELLVRKGLDPNKRNSRGWSGLGLAIEEGRFAALEQLLLSGAEVDRLNEKKQTALMLACRRNEVGMSRLLLDFGANPNAEDAFGETPLWYALKRGSYGCVLQLAAAGADLERQDRWGNKPWDFAQFCRQRKTLEVLNAFKNGEKLQVHNEVERINLGDVSPLLTPDTLDLEAKLEDGETWLSIAVEKARYPQFTALLKRDRQVNQKDVWGESPLAKAVNAKRLAYVRSLVEAGADPLILTASSYTLLKSAIDLNDQPMADYLYSLGVQGLEQTEAIGLDQPSEQWKKWQKAAHKLPFQCPTRTREAPEAQLCDSGVVPPKFQTREKPVFPRAAINISQSVPIILEAVLSKEGYVLDILALQGYEDWAYGYEIEAIKALSKWTYEPGQIDGQPSDVRMTLRIDFKR